MKKLFLPITLLLSIPTAQAMQPESVFIDTAADSVFADTISASSAPTPQASAHWRAPENTEARKAYFAKATKATEEEERKEYADKSWLEIKAELTHACDSGDMEHIESLLKNNIPPTIIDKVFPYIGTLKTAEFILPETQLFLQYGAHPNALDESGNSLAHNILRHNITYHSYERLAPSLLKTINTLIVSGLNTSHENEQTYTIADLAGNYGTISAESIAASLNISTIPNRQQQQIILSSVIPRLKALQHIRECVDQALDNVFIIEPLRKIICEYASVLDRQEEINFIKSYGLITEKSNSQNRKIALWALSVHAARTFSHLTLALFQLAYLTTIRLPLACAQASIAYCANTYLTFFNRYTISCSLLATLLLLKQHPELFTLKR